MNPFFRDYDKNYAYNMIVYVAKWIDTFEYAMAHGQYQRAKRLLNYAMDSLLDVKDFEAGSKIEYKNMWAKAKKEAKAAAKELRG